MGKLIVSMCALASYFEAAIRSSDHAPWYIPLVFMVVATAFSTVLYFMEKADKK